MAKDGTCRGGPRPGLGRPSKALKDKITEGKADSALTESQVQLLTLHTQLQRIRKLQ